MTQSNINNTGAANGALLIRLTLGVVLLAHGLLKLLVFTPAGTVGYFESLGLPPIAAHLTIFAEVAGGSALILGAYARLVALLSLPVLLGATWVHIGNGWVFSNQGGGWEFPAVLVLMALAVVAQGAGRFAVRKIPGVDALIPAALKD